MIIVEGADKLGKSTLVHKLARKLQVPYLHFGPLPDWWRRVHYVTEVVPYAVYSRYHWSCRVYNGIHRQPWDASVEDCQQIDSQLKELCSAIELEYKTVCLYVSDPESFYKDCEDDLFSMEQVKLANQKFMGVSKHFDLAWDVCDGWPDVDWVLGETK